MIKSYGSVGPQGSEVPSGQGLGVSRDQGDLWVTGKLGKEILQKVGRCSSGQWLAYGLLTANRKVS